MNISFESFRTIGKNTRVLVGCGIVALVVIALLAFMFKNEIRSWTAFALAPQEVKEMLFISGASKDTAGITSSSFGFFSTEIFEGKTVISIAQNEKEIVGILKDTTNNTFDVYHIEGKKLTPLTTDGKEKAGVAISPEGTAVAFSYVEPFQGTLPEGVTEDSVFDIRRYELSVLDRSSSELKSYGNGVHAHFLDDSTLFFIAEKGFVVKSTKNEMEEVYPDSMVFRMKEAPVFISSRSFAVRNTLIPQIDVFTFLNTSPLNLAFERSIPVDRKLGSFTASPDGSLYGVVQNEKQHIVLKNLEESSDGYQLPKTIIPRLILSK